MFIEAIVNENIDRDYLCLKIGDKLSGNVRSYSQNFIKIPEFIGDVSKCDDLGEIIEVCFKERIIKVSIKEGSIKKIHCGCGNIAEREDHGEYLCKDCIYEEPEDFSYLSQTPWESE